MKVFYDLANQLTPTDQYSSLTLGNFDGLHKGHKAVLSTLQDFKIVVSFINTPLAILKPSLPISQLVTLDHKIKLFEDFGIDILFLLTFDQEFAGQSAEEFILKLKACTHFNKLILGPDASFGKNKQGDKQHIHALASKYDFNVEYLEPILYEHEKISTSKIKNYLKEGNFQTVECLLGRKYSIYTEHVAGQGLGSKLGFPTLNINVEKLCLPPLGVYAVHVAIESSIYKAVANLGLAPTVRDDLKPILEVHILEPHPQISMGTKLEVIFEMYLRPEIKFTSIDDLKKQIASDILKARSIL